MSNSNTHIYTIRFYHPYVSSDGEIIGAALTITDAKAYVEKHAAFEMNGFKRDKRVKEPFLFRWGSEEYYEATDASRVNFAGEWEMNLISYEIETVLIVNGDTKPGSQS